MANLSDIISGVQITKQIGSLAVQVKNLQFDSRMVGEGDLFFAIKGEQTDGHLFIEKAIQQGAKTIVAETFPESAAENVSYLVVNDSLLTMGLIACNYYGNPSKELKLIGITGTNGKTTTATLLYNMFIKLGYKAGLISTINICINNKVSPSRLTTPDPILINKSLSKMVESGCDYCFMEVSSHAVVQSRIAGLSFTGGVFSNITHDHLDYHQTFNEYIKAKKSFFDQLPERAFALTNKDEKNGHVMLQNTKATKYSYGVKSIADFRAKVIENHLDGMQIQIDGKELWTHFIGQFNAYNLLAVYSVARLLDQSKDEILNRLSELKPINGRFETLRSNSGITAIVDYAHTPDALENVLNTINEINLKGNQIITVVGTGGDRDKTKRPVMAKIAADLSTRVILTSDNPRTEDPQSILKDMEKGIVGQNKIKTITITERREAIKAACLMAGKNDLILVAGKGHENYQEVNGIRHHFDDKEEINKQFELLDTEN